MVKELLSVIIPSRSPGYLQKTVNDLLAKAEGEIEIIVVFDGVWAENFDYDCDKRVKIIHHGTVHDSKGMRASINSGMAIAQGEYVMKCDEHCQFDKGYDKKLKTDCEENWVVIPRRKRLDADKWEIIEDGRPDICYMYVEYPFLKPLDETQGLHGAEWRQRHYDRKDILIDDTPTMQGSCYFMKKSYWDRLFPNGLDDENYGSFTAEAQEISMPVWLSGGRIVVNKKTFYAHWHKGHAGKGYGFSNQQYKDHSEQKERGRLFCISKWLYTKEYKYDFAWFVDKMFPDMPKWPKNWHEQIEIDKKNDYSTLKYKDSYWLSNLKGQDLNKLIIEPMKKLKNRIELAKYFAELGFVKGAEVGVYDGYYSEILVQNIPNVELLSIDSWGGMGHDKGNMKDTYRRAIDRLAPYHENITIIKKDSVSASNEIKDGSQDFVFIDACHCYDCVKKDIEAWVPKVRIGGIVSGHDAYKMRSGNTGVLDAINEYVKNNNVELQLTEWNKDENKDNRQPCWYFFKK
jgi:glycosyltransferase involved in cell wall biosynthesis